MRTLLFFCGLVAVTGCSGSSAFVGVDGSDGGTHGDAAPGDGGNPDDGSPGGACPAAQPAQGAACTSADLYCEYGGTGPELLCSTTARCNRTANGAMQWFVSPPAPSCIGSQAQNPADCPSSFTAMPTGAACPSANFSTRCVYTEGMCGCLPCQPEGGGTMSQEWACTKYPQPQGCPEPRPRAGSACAQEGQSCAYGTVCDVVSGVPNLGCTNGRWQVQPIAAACALHQCGK